MANVRTIEAYMLTQSSSLQIGQRVGGHLALTDFHSEDQKWTLAHGSRRWQHNKYCPGNYYYYHKLSVMHQWAIRWWGRLTGYHSAWQLLGWFRQYGLGQGMARSRSGVLQLGTAGILEKKLGNGAGR